MKIRLLPLFVACTAAMPATGLRAEMIGDRKFYSAIAAQGEGQTASGQSASNQASQTRNSR